MLVAYLLLILSWPWPPIRFLFPLMPLWLIYPLRAWAVLWTKCPQLATARLLPVAVLGLVILSNLNLQRKYTQLSRETGYPMLSVPVQPTHWSSYQATFTWIRTNTNANDLLAAEEDGMTYLYTARPVFHPLAIGHFHWYHRSPRTQAGQASELVRVLKRYRPHFVILTAAPGFPDHDLYEAAITQLNAQNPDWLKMVYQGDDLRFKIFELYPAYEPNHEEGP